MTARDTLELRVHRLVRSLHASSATIDVELTRMGLPLEYDPSPLDAALNRLSVSVDAVREVLGQRECADNDPRRGTNADKSARKREPRL